ncbi:MAG: acetate--CoA ligase family protein [Prevotellaceae bacterium]|jgi:acetyltransferase|nr:acetate--CoA ligase family protein [Prevotellaceae bacterium]
MITQQLITPESIVVVGGSDDIHKPGGKVIKNLTDYKYSGALYAVNPKADSIQGIRSFRTVEALPPVDLAILAIPAAACPAAVDTLAKQKNTKAFIILSAGFHEENEAGATLEAQIVKTVNEANASLIGPNCIGVLTTHYTGVFTTPIPELSPEGVDFITGSGATAVFIIDAAMQNGLRFSSVYSVGNSAQIGVEEVLEYMDNTYCHGTSAKVKMLYVESIQHPAKLLKHAASLVRKGARIAAIKAGSSEAGSRAASSHTGALATPDAAVDALFRKAGIIRCYSRSELVTVAGILSNPLPKGKNIAIVTHAGGPAVMLTDTLSHNGINVPAIGGDKAAALLAKLFSGSSVANPIDFLATGTATQLAHIIDACNNDFSEIDAMAVIFGNPGLVRVFDVYGVISEKMKTAAKPIYPVMPTVINSREEIAAFVAKGHVTFPDEVIFGNALAKVLNNAPPADEKTVSGLPLDYPAVRALVEQADDGYLPPQKVQQLLDAAGIPRAGEAVAASAEEAVEAAVRLGFPVVMKVVGPVHKSDVGGVALDIKDAATVRKEFERMIKIPDTTAVLLQPMLSGVQLFAGVKRELPFGWMTLCGLGGIFVEALHDVSACLAPVSPREAVEMLRRLRGYKIIQGLRGQTPVNEQQLTEIVMRISNLCEAAPEISEMDLNPLLGAADKVVAVDARIRIEKLMENEEWRMTPAAANQKS